MPRDKAGVTFPSPIELGDLPRSTVDRFLNRSFTFLGETGDSRESIFLRLELIEDPHNCDGPLTFSHRNWIVGEHGDLPFDGIVYRRKIFGGWEERVTLALTRDFPLD